MYFTKSVVELAIIPIKYFIFFLVASASTVACSWQQGPYFGLNAGLTYCSLQHGYGQTIFAEKSLTQGSIFAGWQFAPLLSIELEYAKTYTDERSVYVQPATSEFGISNFTTIASSVYNTKQDLRSLSILYAPRVKVYASWYATPFIGVVQVHATANLSLVEFDGAPATDLEQSEYALNFSASRIVPKFGLRLQYKACKNFYLHSYVSCAQTSRITMQATRQIFPSQILTARLKNATNIGLGCMYAIL